jgi:hypothetical protein
MDVSGLIGYIFSSDVTDRELVAFATRFPDAMAHARCYGLSLAYGVKPNGIW